MWMARVGTVEVVRQVDFLAARDEGLAQAEQILDNYGEFPLSRDEMRNYLTENITFQLDESLERGMQRYFELAEKHGLIDENKPLEFVTG